MAAAVEQLNIEIAFQFMNGVAQRRRRFVELCRRGGKAPSFSSASRMTRTSSSGFIAAPLGSRFTAGGLLHRHHQRIGVLVLKPQFIADTVAINQFSAVAVWAVGKHRRGNPSSRAICG
jgi:hypothetical protein